ncbi:hypothetical protein H6F96_20820 [Microcoleus sp. FACHB-53]|nr:hypothetical protein [Microcoleus sp. FACHB-53]
MRSQVRAIKRHGQPSLDIWQEELAIVVPYSVCKKSARCHAPGGKVTKKIAES